MSKDLARFWGSFGRKALAGREFRRHWQGHRLSPPSLPRDESDKSNSSSLPAFPSALGFHATFD
jgi:hypothetical protein